MSSPPLNSDDRGVINCSFDQDVGGRRTRHPHGQRLILHGCFPLASTFLCFRVAIMFRIGGITTLYYVYSEYKHMHIYVCIYLSLSLYIYIYIYVCIHITPYTYVTRVSYVLSPPSRPVRSCLNASRRLTLKSGGRGATI